MSVSNRCVKNFGVPEAMCPVLDDRSQYDSQCRPLATNLTEAMTRAQAPSSLPIPGIRRGDAAHLDNGHISTSLPLPASRTPSP